MDTKGIDADLVIKNATVVTVDPGNTISEAVAVFGGKIVKVGTNRGIAPFVGEKSSVLDLEGKTLIPGFNDSHTHNVATGEFLHSLGLIDAAPELTPTIPVLLSG